MRHFDYGSVCNCCLRLGLICSVHFVRVCWAYFRLSDVMKLWFADAMCATLLLHGLWLLGMHAWPGSPLRLVVLAVKDVIAGLIDVYFADGRRVIMPETPTVKGGWHQCLSAGTTCNILLFSLAMVFDFLVWSTSMDTSLPVFLYPVLIIISHRSI